MPTNVALGLLTDKTYTFDNAQARQFPAQYVRTIMQHGIECNIVDVANQLSFVYQGLAPKLRMFISPSTESTKAANFIYTLEKKQEVWYEMLTIPATSHRYYNPAWKSPSYFYRLPLSSQFEVFLRYQSQ